MRNILNYDLVVIGGGPAGLSAANTAAILGRRVALIECESRIGGAGINSGTLPSKTLRETALALSGWRSRDLFGVDLSLRRDATISDFMHHYLRVSDQERARMEGYLQILGVTRYEATASFENPHTVRLTPNDGKCFSIGGDIILIATGSAAVRPEIYPFDDDRVHDSDELLSLTKLPKKLVVIGSGVIGSEYACTFAALGVEVHIIDSRDKLLPFLDGEVAAVLESEMAKKIQFHWNQKVTRCDVSNPVYVRLETGDGETIECDGVLICAGRTSRTDQLNLAAARITTGPRGVIPVTGHYSSTAAPHIYAAGDVIGSPALAATSMEQARIAMCHAFSSDVKCDLARTLPTGVYTIPEASMVGETEESLRGKGIDYVVGRSHYSENPRGRIIGDGSGFLKLLFDRSDMKLLGVHVIGEHATELVHIGMMAMLMDSSSDIFNRCCFNYPTLGDLYKHATYDAILRKMNRHPNFTG